MEEAPENDKESYSAHANGMNECDTHFQFPGTFQLLCRRFPATYIVACTLVKRLCSAEFHNGLYLAVSLLHAY
jgi:hypothetical protein